MTAFDHDYTGVAIFIVVLVITAIIGGVVFSEIGEQIEETQQEKLDQGTEVYGNQTIVVSSDDCYETCAQTTDSIDRRQKALLITLDQREVWTGEFKLSESVPGHSIDSAMEPLVAQGLVIEREKTIGTEYRYVGADGKYAGNFTQQELQIWIADQLDAYNGWYTLGELTTSMPANETAVATAIGQLKADGTVQQGREGEGNWFVTYHTAYAHHTVGEEPYTGVGYRNLGIPLGIVALATVVVAVIQRFKNTEKNND